MRVVLAAGEGIGFECLKVLLRKEVEVAAVVVDANEKTRLENRRVKFLARQSGLRLFEIENINDPDFVEEVIRLDPAVIFNIAFLHLYKTPVLTVPRLGCINFHPGPLPKYGGSNGWVWAIINGEKEYGVTFHYMKEKIDTGEIVIQEYFGIEEDDTGLSLLMKCYEHGVNLFQHVVEDLMKGKMYKQTQKLEDRSYYYNKVPYGGIVDVGWSAGKIRDFVRALNFSPFPNPLSPAMVRFDGSFIACSKAEPVAGPGVGSGKSGEVLEIREQGVLMQTGDVPVLLRLGEARGASDMRDFCRSRGIRTGICFGGG